MQRIEAMKWMQRLALLVVVVWSALFGLPLRAQETAGPSGPKPVAWKGTEGGDSPANPKDLEKLAGELETELAKLKLALEVDGSTQELRDKLTKLWVTSTYREEFPRRWDVLVRIVVVRAEELERRGELAAARAVATDLLPRPEAAKELSRLHPSFEFVQASPELIKGAEAARKDPRLVALCARLDAKLTKQPGLAYIGERAGNAGNPAQDENAVAMLEQAVGLALGANQPGMIRDLGARAAPALERLVKDLLDNLPPDATLDPLVLLFEVDEPRGAQFALENWPKGGYLFHKRVLRAMEKAKVLSNSGTWLASDLRLNVQCFTPPKLVETVWRDLLVLAANDIEVRRDSLGLLQTLGEYDGFDAALQRTLSSWIATGTTADGVSVLNMLLAGFARDSFVPIAESALASPNGELRTLAAKILEQYARNDALRARADDPEPEIRMAVARSFSGNLVRTVYSVSGNARGVVVASATSGNNGDFQRSIDARDSACIETLLADSDAGVRLLAIKAFQDVPKLTVSTERLVQLAKDSDPNVRERLAKWGRPEAMPFEVLQVLAADTAPDVGAGKASSELRRIAVGERRGDGSVEDVWDERYLPVLETLLANPLKLNIDVQAVAARVGSSPENARFVVRLARTKPDGRSYALLATVIAATREKLAWDAIGVDEIPTLLREGHAVLQRSMWQELLSVLPERHAAAFRSTLLDAKLTPELRMLAAFASAATADADWNRAFADVVEVLPLGALTGGGSELDGIRWRLGTDERRTALVRELAGRRGPLDSLGGTIQRIQERFTLPEGLALDVLGREHASESQNWAYVQARAIKSVTFTEAEPRLALLERLVGDPWLGVAAIEAIERVHLDAHLPLLERAIQGEFNLGNAQYSAAQLAARALVGYFDDRAAGILLKGIAATSDQSRREAFFKALDEIRRYQDERERWANRKSSKAARDAAIAELVPMLADKDATIRAQAAKSLGALEAVEQLPALVRLLNDSNDGVRKAAQSAIDVLTAPKPVPPAPEAPKSDAPAKKDE